MTDTTANNTDIGDRINQLAEQVSKSNEMLARFAGAVTSLLSGTQAAPSQATGKRRGRPPKAASQAQTAAVAAPKPREIHALERRSLELIEQRGRISQTELADTLSKETGKTVERAAVEYHTKELLKEGKIVKRTVMPGGVKTILYYRRDWASFRGE
jgi:hypothetical protein